MLPHGARHNRFEAVALDEAIEFFTFELQSCLPSSLKSAILRKKSLSVITMCRKNEWCPLLTYCSSGDSWLNVGSNGKKQCPEQDWQRPAACGRPAAQPARQGLAASALRAQSWLPAGVPTPIVRASRGDKTQRFACPSLDSLLFS